MKFEITDEFLESIKGVKLNHVNILKLVDYEKHRIEEMRAHNSVYLGDISLENLFDYDEYSTFSITGEELINSISEKLKTRLTQNNASLQNTFNVTMYSDYAEVFTVVESMYIETEESFCARMLIEIKKARYDYQQRLRLNETRQSLEQKAKDILQNKELLAEILKLNKEQN